MPSSHARSRKSASRHSRQSRHSGTASHHSSASRRSGDSARSSKKADPEDGPIYLKEDSQGKMEPRKLDAPNSTLKYESENKLPKGPYVLTGPVIGMVTDTDARVLIETNCPCQATCFLTNSEGHQFAVQKSFKGKRPASFKFSGLSPETYYKVSLNIPTPGLIKSGFRTIPTQWSLRKRPANFGFVSCNKYRITRDDVPDKFDLWKDLYKRAAHGDIDYLIHMGDNVYADSDLFDVEAGTLDDISDCRWQIALEMLKDVPREEWPRYYKKICETCRTIYRETWNHAPTKHTLANVPNLMILDDHDIRDDWGDRPADRDPTSKEFYIACCFYNVYNEYQRNLYEDYESVTNAYDSTKVGQTHHFHVFGDIGLMLTDARGCKTFHRNYNDEREEDFPLMGVQQWKDMEAAMTEGGYFDDCRMLFAICPQPPCYIGEGPNMFIAKLGKFFDDLYGSWTASYHVPEASMFLQGLFDWRAADPGHREVCIVAGDVHEAGYTDIVDLRYSGLGDRRVDRMKQVTTSAIANTITKPHEHQALNIARTMVNSVGKWHQFSHYNWTGMRNFNVINIYTEKDERAERKFGFRGLATRFSSQLFGASATNKKTFSEVNSYHRTLATAGGWLTCYGGFGVCGAGQCGPVHYGSCMGTEQDYRQAVEG